MNAESVVVENPIPAVPTAEPSALLGSLRIIRPGNVTSAGPESETTVEPAPETPVPVPEPAPETPTTPEPEKKEETPEPEKKEEPKAPEEDPTKGMSEPASKKFKGILKRAEKAEQERDEHHKALETLRAEHETLRKETAEFEALRKQAVAALDEADRYKKELKAVAIERDPEFQQQFNAKILSKQTTMMNLAVGAGAAQGDFVKAINTGNESELEGFRDMLEPHQQRAWDNARLEIDNLATQRREAIGNPEKTWQDMEENRKKQFATDVENTKRENVSMARNAVAEIWKSNEKLSNPDPDMAEEIQSTREEVEKLTAHVVTNLERPDIIKLIAGAFLLDRNAKASASAIEGLEKDVASKDAKIAELEEKLGEQETFIKEASRNVPRSDLGGNKSPATQNGSLLSAVRVRIPGQ